jgi:signal transduction histidine kinase/ActR/RegA family two-component response regulator
VRAGPAQFRRERSTSALDANNQFRTTSISMSLKQILNDCRDEILARFVQEVERKDLPPPGLPRSVLLDHLPLFLNELSDELSASDGSRPSRDAMNVTETARQHGEQRWQVGYDLQAVVREYGVLRHAVLETAKARQMPLSIDEADVLARYLNLGVASATAEYVRVSEERLKERQADLLFLCEAGELLSSSLDSQSTLARLTRLLVPRLADYCIVHLDGYSPEDVPIAHVDPTKVELLREALRSFGPKGSYGHRQVVHSGRSLLLDSVAPEFLESVAETPGQLALLQRIAPCSLLVVPLQIKSNLLGTITLARSNPGPRYDSAQLLLAEDLARRAAAAIDNARLYELSRNERAIAEAATRTKDEFVAMVSHELRTPLNVIMGWVRLLRSGSLSDATREQALEVVERNANAQSQLVADLLDISRVITGKIRIEPAQVDLRNLVSLVLEDARFALEAKRIELHVDFANDATVMRGDGERLRQVVWNLLLNAIKFTPKGGQIWVSLSRVESDLVLVVRDNGLGISAEFLPHIFESFRQYDSKTTRAHRGLGIGLSIAKHLIDLHGGSIEARSDGPGKGASFSVRLPLSPLISATIGVSKLPATRSLPADRLQAAVLGGLHILVVDDEQDARDLLRIVLESCEVSVLEASSVEEALAAVRQERVDLIVSDIGMPEEDGYSLIRKVRALPTKEKAGIPAIALTAFAGNEDRTRALLEGFNVHMAKPVEPSELLLALADLAKHLRKSSAGGGAASEL